MTPLTAGQKVAILASKSQGSGKNRTRVEYVAGYARFEREAEKNGLYGEGYAVLADLTDASGAPTQASGVVHASKLRVA